MLMKNKKNEERKIKAAVIGLGNMGKNHARIYHELEECELVAVADVNRKVGEELSQRFNCRYYEDYKKMLESEDMDCVSIVVPTKMHEEVALYCIGKKKHILLEKPITDNIKSAEKLIKNAKENNIKLMIGHIERFNPAVGKLKEIIDEGRLGKVISMIARRVGISPPQIKDANVIIDLAVHDIDIMNFLTGATVKKINAHAEKALLKDREDYAEILMEYDNGASGFIQVNWITPIKVRNLVITGTKGYAELDYITQELKLYESIYEEKFDDFNEFIIKFGTPKTIDCHVEKKEPLKEELSSFIKSISEDKTPKTTGEDGLYALKIALDAMERIK